MRIDVRQSGIWQTNSTLISVDGVVLCVDPAYFPRELDDLGRLAGERGEVGAVLFTHGHWDHVVGWRTFPSAPVWASASLAAAVARGADVARANLERAREFDARWYVRRDPSLTWPGAVRGLGDGEEVHMGGISATALHLPGHSEDGVAMLLPEARLLLPGDYLSPCEIPFVEDLAAYRATAERLARLLDEVAEVIPGHGPRLTAAEARAVLDADRRYLEALAGHAARRDRAAALAMPLPRAADVPGMREHHAENLTAAGLGA